MLSSRLNIAAELRNEILRLQGFKSFYSKSSIDIGLGPVKYCFPNAVFPTGAIHEFLYTEPENFSASSGFVSGILSAFMKKSGVILWISSSKKIFPPALKAFGIDPEQVIFICKKNEKDVLWTMEEALKCDALTAVVCEMHTLDFTVSRRFQLAVEKTNVTGFILHYTKKINTTACITRWKISAAAFNFFDDMPGVGYPCWNVELLKVRNGKPGSWQIGWYGNRFIHLNAGRSRLIELQRRTG